MQEYKVVVPMNDYGMNFAPFICDNHVKGKRRLVFAEGEEEKVVAFAVSAIAELQASNPGAVAYAPLLRVDIMRMQDGRWVVNEFESLEAMSSKKDGTGNHDSNLSTYLETFWVHELTRIIN